MNAWLFQGNPTTYDIDTYCSRHSSMMYWRTPQHRADIRVGDRVYMWRAGAQAGLIAVGDVVELPTAARLVSHPDSLRNDLWANASDPDPNDIKTGIRLHQVRLTTKHGMVPRDTVKRDRELAEARFIVAPRVTVYLVPDAQSAALDRLWDAATP